MARFRPPFGFSPLWQLVQYFEMSGAISFVKLILTPAAAGFFSAARNPACQPPRPTTEQRIRSRQQRWPMRTFSRFRLGTVPAGEFPAAGGCWGILSLMIG